MAWGIKAVQQQRVEFAVRAQAGAPMAELCREFQISRPTGYLWRQRYEQGGLEGVAESSRRPHSSPQRTAVGIEQHIDRKSTRLNSSHRCISYAVFCLK